MQVRDAMTTDVLLLSPDTGLGEAARLMSERDTTAALVDPGGGAQPGIFTVRDVLRLVAEDRDFGGETLADHFTPDAAAAAPDASLQRAAEIMLEGQFRHVVVSGNDGNTGFLVMRDIVAHRLAQGAVPGTSHPIFEAMRADPLTVGQDTTVRDTTQRMMERQVGAAVVEAPKKGKMPGIFTERVLLHALADGRDTGRDRMADHPNAQMTFSAPQWSLRQAAEAMVKGRFQHVVVVDRHTIRGVVSMRDVMRQWTEEDREEN